MTIDTERLRAVIEQAKERGKLIRRVMLDGLRANGKSINQ